MRTLICTIFAAAVALATPGVMAHTIRIVGHLEDAAIVPVGLTMKAKMDTGADMTSIHAVEIEKYAKGSQTWVRFTLEGNGRAVIVRRPLVKIAKVRSASGTVERLVVQLGVCVAGYHKVIQVNLTDRSRMSTPMLIGKRFMRSGGLVVDPASEHVGRPICD